MAEPVRITSKAPLPRWPEGECREIFLAEPVSLEALLKRLGLSPGEYGFVTREDAMLSPGQLVKKGDVLMIYPFLEGG